MAETEFRNTWKLAFFILLAITAVFTFTLLGQLGAVQSRLDQANTQLSAFNGSNAQNQRTCIDNAQKFYATALDTPAIMSEAANALSAQTSACQAEYPTH